MTQPSVRVCIAGMHRSGTSLVARLLNLAGLYLGSEHELMPADQHNQEGYWEHTRFVAINDALLRHHGGGWDMPPMLAEGWELAPELLPARAQAATLIQRFAGHPAWGWKDPRTVITLAFWKRLIPELKLIVCLRHPLEVADSLRQRGASSNAFGLKLWLDYNRRLLAATRPDERIVTHYGSYFCDAGAELQRLTGLLRLEATATEQARAVQAVSAGLRHRTAQTVELLQAEVSDEMLEIYAALCAEAGPVYQRLLATEPEPVAQANGRERTPAQVNYAVTLQIARLQARLEAADAALSQARERAEQAVAELSAQVQQKDEALAGLTERLNQKDQALAGLAERLNQKDRALAGLGERLNQKDQALVQLTEQANQKDQALAGLAERLNQKDQALVQLTEQANQKDQALAGLAEQLNQKEQACEALAGQLRQSEAAQAAQAAQLSQTTEALGQTARQLEEKELGLKHLARQVDARERALGELSRQTADRQRILESRVAEQHQALTSLTARLGDRDQQVAELDQERAAYESRARRLEGELANIENSRAWRLVLRWYRLRFSLRGVRQQPRAAVSAPIRAAPPPAETPAPKVLFIAHDAHRHGAQILLLSLLRWLKANTDIPFEILLRGDGELRPEFESLAPVTLIPTGRQPLDAGVAQTFLNNCRQANVQLVYANTITNGDWLEVLGQLHCPVICHVHELDFWINHHTEPGNNRRVKAHTTHFIAVSQAVKEGLMRNLAIPAERIDVIYGFVATQIDTEPVARAAVEIRRQLALPPEAVVIGAAGTTDWRKGADLFLHLARAVVAREPTLPIHFIWLGGEHEGEVFAPLQHDLNRLGLAARVHFLGARPNPLDYLALFDVFALVSREDPFPLVSLEAASLGKPVVCFDGSGGAGEFVETDSGFVVPYLDFESMAERCLELLHSAELRERMGQRAAEKARERHDVNVIGPQVAQLIKRFLAPVGQNR